MKRVIQILVILGVFLAQTGPAGALKPIAHYHDLVAGQGCAGFRDGEFATALFDHPLGLAFSADGNRLYVADQYNNRIRVIHLDEDNSVETLAGSGQTGAQDGEMLQASFNHPAGLVVLPGEKLLINDLGNHLLRIVDPSKKTVTTVAGTSKPGAPRDGLGLETYLDPIWNMVYLPAENCVYFSQPTPAALRKFNLSTGVVSPPLLTQPALSMPKALCLFQDRLCVADWTNKMEVYRLEPTGNTQAGQAVFSGSKIGTGSGVVAMAGWKDDLYALQTADSPIAKVNPYQPVHLFSNWGFSLDDTDPFAMPFLNFDTPLAEAPGFVADPQEPRKFYVASSFLQSVIDFKDYNFERLHDADVDEGPKGLTDYNYPEAKPPHTFRILLVGNSLPTWSHEARSSPSLTAKRDLTFPKQLELFLNTQAALRDLPLHFEVLVYRHKITDGFNMFNWPYYEVPKAMENFDADLAILFSSSTSLLQYPSIFDQPSNSQGILCQAYDPEYLLKPEAVRFADPFVKPFYEKALQKGLLKPPPKGKKTDFPDVGVFLADKDTRGELERIMGKSLGLLRQKIDSMKTPAGRPRGFLLCYAPGGMELACSKELVRVYWKDVCDQTGIPWMDLTAPFEALKTTYAPTYENYTGYHFNVYGSELLANILTYELLDTPWAGYWKDQAGNRMVK